ncbi:MAG: diaminopimelate decarboxylase [Actinomycetia bacterium]|nr:diaminopimelate decarboxylase [Actinomycetes bacterium]MCP4962408.1 diaminopimelate decarboxylase [Actinomycetes bacterium]
MGVTACICRPIIVSLSCVSEWSVEFHPACEKWASQLDQPDAEALLAAVRVLRDQGPTLGRPLVDTIKSSRHNNMKELRPGSTGRSEIRVLFAFDLERHAILLVGGDKTNNWKRWYETNIPIADDRFDKHQAELAQQRTATTTKQPTKKPTAKRRKRR